MHDYGETCHDGKAKWLSKSKAKSNIYYDYKSPVSDLDMI